MRRNAVAFALAGLVLLLAACGRGPNATAPVPPPAEPPLLARAALLGDPARSATKLSPAGDMLAFLAPLNGALNLWVVSTVTLGAARPVTDERAIRGYEWSADGRTLLYFTDDDGDDSYRLMAIDVSTGERRALTEAAHAQIASISSAEPTAVIVALNERSRAWPDLYRIDVTTGSRTLIERNTRNFFRYVLDRNNRVRLGLRINTEGGLEIWRRDADGSWSRFMTAPFEDSESTRPIAFVADGRSFLMYDSTTGDRAALIRVDVESGARSVLAESERADVIDVQLDPATGEPEAFAIEYLRREWRALDAGAQSDFTFLDQQLTGDPHIVSRSADDSLWIVVEEAPTIAPRTYLYNRTHPEGRRLTLLYRNRPALEGAPLQQMIPVEIEARDGLTLVSYLTLPIESDSDGNARPDRPVPMVILAHDGPWGRQSFGFNPVHQWLANRGYAVLSVNHRGSTGFGKVFLNAGNREWGGKMQEDLLDAAQWAIERQIAQPERIAVFGARYGGYAALSALAFTPERFACGVDIAGPSNLEAFLASLPPREEWRRTTYALRVGQGALLAQRSPLTRAAAIQRPLLIGQGARDSYVPRTESDLISVAPRARRAGMVYMLFPDATDVWARGGSRLAFAAVADQFLARCLDGRAEAIGAAFHNVRAQTLAGASRIEGLARIAPPPPPPAPVAEEADEEESSLRIEPEPMIMAPPLAPLERSSSSER